MLLVKLTSRLLVVGGNQKLYVDFWLCSLTPTLFKSQLYIKLGSKGLYSQANRKPKIHQPLSGFIAQVYLTWMVQGTTSLELILCRSHTSNAPGTDKNIIQRKVSSSQTSIIPKLFSNTMTSTQLYIISHINKTMWMRISSDKRQ